MRMLQFGIPDDDSSLDESAQEMLREAFQSDPAWAAKGSLCFEDLAQVAGAGGRLVVELFPDAAPKAVQNFLCLCTGEKGVGKTSKKLLHFKVLHIWPQRGSPAIAAVVG